MKDTHKWTKSKTLMIFVDCLLCLTIIVSSMLIVIDKSRIKNGVIYDGDDVTESSATEATANAEKTTAAVKSARLMFAGDNFLHKGVFLQAQERADGDGYDFSYTYQGVKDIISLADLAFINQETAIDPSQEVSSSPLYNSPSQVIDELCDIGFDVFNQANNHILDLGIDGANNDIDFFATTKSQLVGLYKSEDEMLKAHTVDANGIKVSFVGVTYSSNEQDLSADDDLGLLILNDDRFSEDEINQKLKTMMTNAEKASDIVCVSVHFEDSEENQPSETQQEIVDKLLGYGADIIVGTGPQALQPMEYKENSNGEQALIMWSLGTFMSCYGNQNNLLSGIADVVVNKNSDGSVTIESAKLIPTITHYESDYANLRVIAYNDYTEELAANHGIEAEDFYNYIDTYYTELFGDKLEKEYK